MAKRAGCPVIPFAVVREEAELRPRLFAMMGESKAGPFKGYERLDPPLLGRASYFLGLWFLWPCALECSLHGFGWF